MVFIIFEIFYMYLAEELYVTGIFFYVEVCTEDKF